MTHSIILTHLLAFVLGFPSALATGANADDYDRFGGWKGRKWKATGAFRLERDADRHWFVTPDGHAFLVNGINHVGGNVMERLYNRDYWQARYRQQTGAEAANPREIFEWKVRRDVQVIGWNAFGSHSNPGFNPRLLPYVKTLRFAEVAFWQEPAAEAFVDVFDPAYEAHCARLAREQALPLKDDPYLIGYTFTDGPVLTERDAEPHPNKIYVKARKQRLTTWPERLRNLPASATGKRAYVQTMSKLYGGNIRAFNQIYGATFASFDALGSAVNWRPTSDARNARERADNLQFLLRVLERRWQVESAAVRACDPHHLLFGDKLNGNSDTPDEVIRLSGRMFDVVFVQYYGRWPEVQTLIARCARLTGKPFYMGDASCSVPTENMPDPFGVHSRDHAERTQVYRELYYHAFAQPDFVGWDWCGWMESWELGGQAGKQHSGIQDPFGNLHPVSAAMSEFARELYRVALPPRTGRRSRK